MNQLITAVLPILIPIIFFLGGLVAGNARLSEYKRLLVLRTVSFTILISAVLMAVSVAFSSEPAKQGLVVINGITLIVLLLVSFMGIILIRFSERYLSAEANANQYWRWLLFSLTSVSVVILSNHLLLFWLGWVAISMCFHRLLLFYPDRPRAVLAAHKKFILGRIAELCLLTAILLLYWQHGTFHLSVLNEYFLNLTGGSELSLAEKFAAFFIAQTALIKCAQLPLHGWLIQVVEAPTPISALLHAGIINLGGFLLIAFAPLISYAPVAQWTILIVAGLSTCISALVMMTRITVKVRLAWSTCAQMGLMLIECALGLYEVALLHLFTHSLYKAYMFLSAGEMVQDYSLKQLAPQEKVNLVIAIACLSVSFSATAMIALFSNYQGPISLWLLVTTALALYLVSAVRGGTLGDWLSSCFTVALLVGFYLAGKALFSQVLPALPMTGKFDPMDIWLGVLFVALFALTVQIRVSPHAKQTQTLYRWLFSGLYLDEIMTRVTLRVWPIQLRAKDDDTMLQARSVKESLL
ncbi:NADH-quinone oxidoreductase subunit L [Methylophaga sp.]|uniref:NADH-quinone oxidoreductase subunit L n=1 Tax=Methylophaga sp. TaxID=2024840 RepID=UPI003F695FEC